MHEAVDDQRAEREALRRALRQQRAALPAAEVRAASDAVAALLAALPALARARTVAAYAATAGEIDPATLVVTLAARGARVLYPRVVMSAPPTLAFHAVTEAADLAPGRFGIAAPPADAPAVPLEDADVVLVPGVAFAADGHRLGFGGGYYDRALATAPRPLRVGLCHSFQLVAALAPAPGDQPVDLIVTPTGRRPTGARPFFAPEEVLS